MTTGTGDEGVRGLNPAEAILLLAVIPGVRCAHAGYS
jgi:hypothetical protein